MVLVKWDLHLLPNKCIQTINVEKSNVTVNANGSLEVPVMVGEGGNLDQFLMGIGAGLSVEELELA